MSQDSLYPKTDEITLRLARLQEYLWLNKLDACLIEDPIDLFYYTGLHLSYGRLWIHKEKAALFVDGRYLKYAEEHSYLQPVFALKPELEKKFIKFVKAKKIAFDSSKLTVGRSMEIQNFLDGFCLSYLWKPIEKMTSSLRRIKGPFEISYLKESIDLLSKCFKHTVDILKEGVSELEVAREFQIYLRTLGAEEAAFDPIIAFGENTAMPHHKPSDRILKKNDIILLDVGVVYKRYHSDMTRVLFHGNPEPILINIASVVRKAHKAALDICRPGIKVSDLDEAARSVMREHHMEDYFLHSLGHGIGLETHESPTLRKDGKDKDMILQPGMVITIEPGLYLAGTGGIRWEDMILITETGYDNLTGYI
ncbi:MAG: aminopeptidase P family protein [Chlamydiae bacterium]|nr:aminopeptidase P family protein [Chlamydiota bacterium]